MHFTGNCTFYTLFPKRKPFPILSAQSWRPWLELQVFCFLGNCLLTAMEEKEEGKHQDLVLKPSSLTTISSSESISMLSATLGRVMHTLLNARPKKLQDTISRLQSPPKMAPLSGKVVVFFLFFFFFFESFSLFLLCISKGIWFSCSYFLLFIFPVSLEQSLWFLHKYVGEAAEKGETLDEVLVPMLEHVFILFFLFILLWLNYFCQLIQIKLFLCSHWNPESLNIAVRHWYLSIGSSKMKFFSRLWQIIWPI